MNAQDVCAVCGLPAELLLGLDECMYAAFPWRREQEDGFFHCFQKPMGFRPWERAIIMPARPGSGA